MLKNFLKEEDGMGTAEVVVIAAVLVAMALIFKKNIENFINKISEEFINPDTARLDLQTQKEL